MKARLLDYELPEKSIAQRPCRRREQARLLVLRRIGLSHETIAAWPELVPRGALVVVNDTRVVKARLLGERIGTGGNVELFVLRKLEGEAGTGRERCSAVGRASRPFRAGQRVAVGGIEVEVTSRHADGTLELALPEGHSIDDALERWGSVPLPPYIRRPADLEDGERYQTVFARHAGSVAAPTAGLHLTSSLLADLRARSVDIGFVTLHVGLGTFRPISVDDVDDHAMDAERFEVSKELVSQVSAARERGAPVIAVGTTVVRCLESARVPERPERVRATRGSTDLFIRPGYRFGPVDGLLTNFHAPRSTLLALVIAFAGFERVHEAYAVALQNGYRFLSYGDAMYVPERLA